ncbi:MAG: hypothetical protein J6A75_13570 [Lachnospiraceae bacterium]|nr:hypothetical protein [Lachnospiraceae bacterium]
MQTIIIPDNNPNMVPAMIAVIGGVLFVFFVIRIILTLRRKKKLERLLEELKQARDNS